MSRGLVLVVDDDPTIRDTVAELLDCEGYAVHTTANGHEALRYLEYEDPCLVLLDARMPVMDGWEVARQLRQRGLRVPVLVMTAADDAARWAREIGAAGVVAKPFELLELLQAVEQTGSCE